MNELASLPLFHRIGGQSVLVLGDGPMAEPKRRLVERAGGSVMDDFARAVDEGVRIAFIAFEDTHACEVAAINARCAGMLINVVDRPDLCDFTTPSILDRDPVLIAIGTNGASAGLAKHLRLRLEQMLPQALGDLAKALHDARPALRKLFPKAADRRRALDEALTEGGVLDPLDPSSHHRVVAWSRGDGDVANENRSIAFDITSADPDDLTIRQARLLGMADVICTDGPIPPAVLARARADAKRRSCEPAHCWSSALSGEAEMQARCPQGPAADGLHVVLRWRPD